MQIPIENIYYLLCYAWNNLEEKDRVSISIDDKTELLDLFAKILINATRLLLKRGVDKRYFDFDTELAGVKGKMDLSQTLKSNLHLKRRTICSFDEFSSNVLMNQILVTTIYRLIRTKSLDKELKNQLKSLLWMWTNVDKIELKSSLFKQVKLNRNNHFYGFILNVCQIIFENSLPSEERGALSFSDFTRNDQKMNQLFESFIRNFYKMEQREYPRVKCEIIKWQFTNTDPIHTQYLPIMETDISLENDREKIIIDAKYHGETMTINYAKEKIKSTNLYQLFGYLLNQEDDSRKTQNATGILLYPTIEKEYDLQFKYYNHHIYIKTVNLNTNWRNIETRLKDILRVGKS
jgi:5-methylcytosine-specific restriction enzyme subunit McrC